MASPYVKVPKDLTQIKNKIAFNLTGRQLACFSCALIIGLPIYFLFKDYNSTLAMILMMCAMIPFFLLGMYEKDGLPAEKILKYFVKFKFLYNKKRIYKLESEVEKCASKTNKQQANKGGTTKKSNKTTTTISK